MSDLISRSKVISVLEQLEEHSLTGKMDISNAIYLLNNQQTAYDIDKVVEEFDAKIRAIRNTKYIENELQNIAIQTIIINVISDLEQIVKQGGVSDDCCEWEHSPTDNNVIRPFHHKDVIGMYEDVLYKFPYCPVCGKKIKIVGD